jgi:hypothetical protein
MRNQYLYYVSIIFRSEPLMDEAGGDKDGKRRASEELMFAAE